LIAGAVIVPFSGVVAAIAAAVPSGGRELPEMWTGGVQMTNIFVGNISFQTDEMALRAAFEEHGEVSSAKIITDWETGRSRGFGFVEMPDDSEAQSAIESMDGMELDGRPLRVNEARPKGERAVR
jgi:RNA recognition motif-containing protein